MILLLWLIDALVLILSIWMGWVKLALTTTVIFWVLWFVYQLIRYDEMNRR